ncbi:response regulator [Hydrogenophaga sp. OTU3427]|uniref:response regulator n=1 Tax=Hydrogenophaga sp. OTU3427 TaxID=3043856 RepID=UPI00313E1EBA
MNLSDMSAPIRLLVVDDHKLFRRGLVALLAQDRRFSVVGEAGDATSALQSAARLRPDLILLDNHMPGVSGIAAIAGLKELLPQVRVLMLTVSENEADLAAGLRAGADGYLLKTIDTQDLADSIQKVWEGDSVISPEMMGKLVGLLREAPEAPALAPEAPVASEPVRLATARRFDTDPSDRIHSLSPRERDILRLIAHGDSNKLIARALDIAETTVKIHVQHILRKLELSNRVHAAVYATERGVV